MSSNVDDELDEIIPCTSACGINADQADGFGFCTCGAEKDRQKVQSLISEQVRLTLEDFAEYCHIRYKGCTQDEYAYDGEVVTMVEDYIAQLSKQEKEGK